MTGLNLWPWRWCIWTLSVELGALIGAMLAVSLRGAP